MNFGGSVMCLECHETADPCRCQRNHNNPIDWSGAGREAAKPEIKETFLVIACDNENGDKYAIFSTMEKASAWADTQEAPCVISPYVVDEPDYGNVRVS